MTTYTFQPVRIRKQQTGQCPACGKTTIRKRIFEHTINPYNRNAAGEMKTYEEVEADVRAEAEAWEPNFRHNTTTCSP